MDVQERIKKSFESGFNQVQKGQVNEVKRKIMVALSINGRATFDKRLKGQISFNNAEIEAVERILNEHGINENIWSDVAN